MNVLMNIDANYFKDNSKQKKYDTIAAKIEII